MKQKGNTREMQMSLLTDMQTEYVMHMSDTQNMLIGNRLREEAKALSSRNRHIIRRDEVKAAAEAHLRNHPQELKIVQHVEEQAAKTRMELKDYLASMPEMFRIAYEAALEKIGNHLQVKNDEEQALNLEVVAAGYDNKLNIYVPVFWEEQSRIVLPGTLCGATIIAATNAARDLETRLDQPENCQGIISMQLSGENVQLMSERFTKNLCEADLSELEKAGVNVHADIMSLHTLAINISSAAQDKTLDSELEGVPMTGNYTLIEAAEIWYEHETTKGTVNGDKQNYIMKLGMRAKEGRLLTEKNGTVAKTDLEDFIRYADVRKQLAKEKKEGRTRFSYDEAAALLGVGRAQVLKYVREDKIPGRKYDEISITALLKFTSNNILRKGRWRKYTNKSPRQTRTNIEQITKHRSNYMTAQEVVTSFNQEYNKVLDLAKKGKFTTYYDHKRTHYLFDRQEIEDFFSRQKG